MSDRPGSTGGPSANTGPCLDEAYKRLARLHYTITMADAEGEALQRRTINDLMDVLELLEPLVADRAETADSRSTGV